MLFRSTKRDKYRSYTIALGSLEECRYYLRLARDLKYGSTDGLRADLEEISKMLTSYASKVRADF